MTDVPSQADTYFFEEEGEMRDEDKLGERLTDFGAYSTLGVIVLLVFIAGTVASGTVQTIAFVGLIVFTVCVAFLAMANYFYAKGVKERNND